MKNKRPLRHKLTIISFSILVCIGVLLSITAQSNNAQTGNPALSADQFKPALGNGAVSVTEVLIQPDGKILAAGDFNSINTTTINGVARFNTDGTLDASFNTASGVDGSVTGLALQADGKVIITGTFTSYNGVDVGRIVRLNADGSIDTTFNPGGSGANSTIEEVKVLANGKIIIAGFFANYNGTAISRLARLNTDGSLDTTFDPGTSAGSTINDVAVQADGKYLIGGAFTTYNGTTINRVARINTDGSLDTTFMIGAGANSTVRAVAVQADGKILILGSFATVDGNARPGIARLNADGTIDTGFAAATAGTSPQAIVFQTDGKMIVGGAFSAIGGASRNGIARLNADGTNDASFDPGTGISPLTTNNVQELALQADGKVIIAGTLSSYNGNPVLGIVRANADGSFDSTFDNYASRGGSVNAIQIQTDGKILIGGTFLTVNRAVKNSIARFNADGTVDSTFMTGTGATNATGAVAVVNVIRVQSDGKILLGGSFINYNGTLVNRIARLNADGTLDATFNTGTGFGGTVNTIAVQTDGKILVGGSYTTFNGTTANRLVRLNTDGTLDSTFMSGTGAGGTVNAITIAPDGKIYIGGTFTSYNGTAINRIARLNSDGTLDAAFDVGTGATSTVNAITVQPDGKIILGGVFGAYNGTNLSRIVRLNPNGSIDPAFNISNVYSSSINEVLLLPNGKILVGGIFQTINGLPRRRLALLTSNGGLDPSFPVGNGLNSTVNVLRRQPDGKVLVGGTFDIFDAQPRTGIARFTVVGSSRLDFDGDGRADLSVFRPSNGFWYLQQSTDGFQATQFGISTDVPVPADYDGDGKTDIAVWRENGQGDPDKSFFYVLNSSDNTFSFGQFGRQGDVPTVVGDWDGDGKADLAVYRGGAQSVFFYRPSSTGTGVVPVYWGTTGDKAVAADYDGDGKFDAAVFRPSDGTWYISQSSNGQTKAENFGLSTDKLVPADYDGDGKTDVAVFRDGEWYIKRSSDDAVENRSWGLASDTPVPADYDGDGRADAAVYRSGEWYILQTSDAATSAASFGTGGDIPTPSVFVR